MSREPNTDMQRLAQSYKRKYGITAPDFGPGKLDTARSRRIADAYDAMQHQPEHPAVKSAYDALAKEVTQQYRHLLEHGYHMQPWYGEGQPYDDSSAMMDDVRNNRHLWFFPTESGYGNGEDLDNPLLGESGHFYNGKPLLYNDLFRAVHDAFGHSQRGYQFGPQGEENAWREHSGMFTPLAAAALTSETRGQNSWVNFGKHIRRPDGTVPKAGDPDWVHPNERPYAEQKTGLLPREFWYPDDTPHEAD